MSQIITVNKVHTFTGHKDSLYTLVSLGGGKFVSSGADGMIVLWSMAELDKGKLIAKVSSSVYALNYIKEQNILIIGQNFQGIHIIDMNTLKEIKSVNLTKSAIFDIKSDNSFIYVACGDGEIIVLESEGFTTVKKLKATHESARTLAINAHHISVGYSDNHIRVFEKINLKMMYEINAHKSSIFTLKYDPTGKWLLSGSRDAHLKIWDTRIYEMKESIVAHLYAINHIEYSPDGQHFVTCSMDKSIKVWDSTSFKLIKVIDKARHAGHGTSVNKLMWITYENYLTSCSDDRTISVWKINFSTEK